MVLTLKFIKRGALGWLDSLRRIEIDSLRKIEMRLKTIEEILRAQDARNAAFVEIVNEEYNRRQEELLERSRRGDE